jgi:hypothetical protein
MTAKEYLSGLQLFNIRIEQLHEEKQMYLDMATSITTSINPVKVRSSHQTDRMGNAVSKAADMDALIDEEICNLWFRQHEIVKQIQQLRNAKYIQVLYKIYVQDKSIKIASVEMQMSYEYIKQLHQKALAEFENVHADILAERTAV